MNRVIIIISKLNSKKVNQKSLSGIYIHIPFCKQACHYCNFHFSTSQSLRAAMIEAIAKEIMLTPVDSYPADIIGTVYFGGGTPSILSIEELQIILDALNEKFVIGSGAEITLEANPDDITTLKLDLWRQMGINRLSVGIQSFVEAELVWMNRPHTVQDALQCIDRITASGFTNFSIDLIYGSPLLSNKDWQRNVEIVIQKNIPHISCYALTVEPRTALDKMISANKKAPVHPERQAEQFLLLMQWMRKAGYDHYEISNFSKPNKQSRHNSSYWQGKHYYGFGPSAHSYNGLARKWNVSNNALYISSLQNNVIPFEEEVLNNTQKLNEYVMTSLRTMEGLNLNKVETVYGLPASEHLLRTSNKWQMGQKVILRDSSLILTDEGKLFADGIAADLFT